MTRPSDRQPFPLGAKLIIAFEFCERFAFYSTLSLLVLFLTGPRVGHGLGWTEPSALAVVGMFTGAVYAAPILGGWAADRLIGHRRAVMIGGSLMVCGYGLLVLAAQTGDERTLWGGLFLLVLGNALLKATLVVVLGDSFGNDGSRRDAAYAYYYAGINLGGLVAGVAAGSVAAALGWSAGFALAGAALLAALLMFAAMAGRLGGHREALSAAADDNLGDPVAARLVLLSVFALLLLIYEVGAFQLWGTMSLYLEHKVDRHVGAFVIPTQWFTSVNAAALILAAPLYAALWTGLERRGRPVATGGRYAIALLLGGGGLLLFGCATLPALGSVSWMVACLAIAVQATGEVGAWTSTYGLVYRLAPPRAVAAVMGAFYALTLGLGGYGAGIVGKLATTIGYRQFFSLFGIVTVIAGLGALAANRALARWENRLSGSDRGQS